MHSPFIDALLGLSEGLAGVTDLRLLRQLAAAGVAKASDSKACWLWLLDQGGTTLRPGATSGAPVPPWRWRVPLHTESLIAQCLAVGEPVSSVEPGRHAILGAPLLGPARFVGALLCYRDAARPYQEWEAEELTFLANFLGPLTGDVAFYEELGEVYQAGLGVLISAVGLADGWLAERAQCAAHLALRLARRLNLSPATIRSVQWCALFYDVSPVVADRWLLSPRNVAAGAPRTVLAQGPLALLPGLELSLERIAGARGMGLDAREAAIGTRVATLVHEFVRLSAVAQMVSGAAAGPATESWRLSIIHRVLDTLRQREGQAWDGTVIETLSELIHGEAAVAGAPAGLAPPALTWVQPVKAA